MIIRTAIDQRDRELPRPRLLRPRRDSAEAERLRPGSTSAFPSRWTLARRQGRPARPGDVQIAFAAEVFPALVPWLMLNHGCSAFWCIRTPPIRAAIISMIHLDRTRGCRACATMLPEEAAMAEEHHARHGRARPQALGARSRPASSSCLTRQERHARGISCIRPLPIRPRWVKPNPAEYFRP